MRPTIKHDRQDNTLPKVLLFCPTVRLEPETLDTIYGLQYNGPLVIKVTRDNPKTPPQANILYNYQRARAWLLAEDYDYLFTVENDMIIPPFALERLLETAQAHDADIVHGVYVFRHGTPSINIIRKDVWESYSNQRNKREWRKRWGTAFEAGGLGYGCTLIRRRVMEKLELRTATNGSDSDSVLAEDARKHGMKVMADARVICGHKRPDGVVLWPRQDGGYDAIGSPVADLVQVRCVRSGFATRPGLGDNRRGMIIINPGETGHIDRETAMRMIAAGVAELVEDEGENSA